MTSKKLLEKIKIIEHSEKSVSAKDLCEKLKKVYNTLKQMV